MNIAVRWEDRVTTGAIQAALPGWAKQVAIYLRNKNVPLYAVGGWVRDVLLNRALPFDFDVTSALTPPELAQVLEGAENIDLETRNSALGTMEIHVRDGQGLHLMEYTPLRAERYDIGHRPAQVSFGVSLQEDALRRDFRMNALYVDVLTGELIDPLGGLDDLRAGRLSTCRAPEQTFADDGLRLLRLARFAAGFGLNIDPLTWQQACGKAGKIDEIVPERIFTELERMLLPKEGHPRDAVGRAFRLLRDMGVLERILPGINADQAELCDRLIEDRALRWAALLYRPGQTGQENADRAKTALSALKAPAKLRQEVLLLTETAFRLKQTQEARFILARAGREAAEKALCLLEVLPEQKEKGIVLRELFAEMCHDGTPFSLEELALNGKELCCVAERAPGKWVGTVLEDLWAECIARPEMNTKEILSARARALAERKDT